MGKGSAGMTDQYSIEIQRPLRARRGDSKLIVVVTDAQGKELFRDRADLNEEKSRISVAKRIAGITGDTGDAIAGRLLDKLGQPPASFTCQQRAYRRGGPLPLRGDAWRLDLEQRDHRGHRPDASDNVHRPHYRTGSGR